MGLDLAKRLYNQLQEVLRQLLSKIIVLLETGYASMFYDYGRDVSAPTTTPLEVGFSLVQLEQFSREAF